MKPLKKFHKNVFINNRDSKFYLSYLRRILTNYAGMLQHQRQKVGLKSNVSISQRGGATYQVVLIYFQNQVNITYYLISKK